MGSSFSSARSKCGRRSTRTSTSLFEYQYNPEHDVMTHITEIETMASQLSDVGAPMNDVQIMTKIVCTLPPSYRNFTTVWSGVPIAERTIALLTSRLLKEESMNLRHTGGKQDAVDAAFFLFKSIYSSSKFNKLSTRWIQQQIKRTWKLPWWKIIRSVQEVHLLSSSWPSL